MKLKKIIIYDYDNLFNILDEIKNYLHFELKKANKENLQQIIKDFKSDYLIISRKKDKNLKNNVSLDNIPSKINFAGYYSPVIIKKLYDLATRLGVKNSIEFSGIYKQEDANPIYNSADIYFYFVHQSNCPNSVIEAMSTGMPTLTSNTGGMPEIVTQDSGICLDCVKSWEIPQLPSVMDAVIGVKKIINNYDDYSNNCIKKVWKDHNINNWINRHEEIFKKFI